MKNFTNFNRAFLPAQTHPIDAKIMNGLPSSWKNVSRMIGFYTFTMSQGIVWSTTNSAPLIPKLLKIFLKLNVMISLSIAYCMSKISYRSLGLSVLPWDIYFWFLVHLCSLLNNYRHRTCSWRGFCSFYLFIYFWFLVHECSLLTFNKSKNNRRHRTCS